MANGPPDTIQKLNLTNLLVSKEKELEKLREITTRQCQELLDKDGIIQAQRKEIKALKKLSVFSKAQYTSLREQVIKNGYAQNLKSDPMAGRPVSEYDKVQKKREDKTEGDHERVRVFSAQDKKSPEARLGVKNTLNDYKELMKGFTSVFSTKPGDYKSKGIDVRMSKNLF